MAQITADDLKIRMHVRIRPAPSGWRTVWVQVMVPPQSVLQGAKSLKVKTVQVPREMDSLIPESMRVAVTFPYILDWVTQLPDLLQKAAYEVLAAAFIDLEQQYVYPLGSA